MRRFLLLFLLVIPAVSVQAGETRTIDLTNSVSTALKNNLTLIEAQKSMEMASNEIDQAFANLVMPSLTGSAGYSLSDPWSVHDMNDPLNLSTYTYTNYFVDNYSAGLTLSRTLFNGFRYYNSWLTKKEAYDFAEKTWVNQRNSIIANVRTSFYNLLLLRENQKIVEDLDASLKANRDSAEVKYKAGYMSEYDFISEDVQYENNRPNLLKAGTAYDQAKLAFLQLLGLDIHADVEFKGTLMDSTNFTVEETDTNVLYRLALSNDITILGLESSLRTAEYALKITEGSRYPSVVGTIGGVLNYKKQYETDPSRSLVPSGSISLNLLLPLDGWVPVSQTAKAVEEGKMAVDKLRVQIQDQVSSIKLQVDTLLMQIAVSKEIVASQDQNVKQALLAYKMAEDKFNLGASSSLDLTSAEVAYNQAQANRLQSIYDYFSGNIKLIQMIGQ